MDWRTAKNKEKSAWRVLVTLLILTPVVLVMALTILIKVTNG